MIKAYLTWISTPYEGEDIEVRYRIFEDEELILKESIILEYTKPALCGLASMSKLLKVLEKHIKKEIVIVINDGALYELLNASSRTKKEDVQYMAHKVRKAVDKFFDIRIENVGGDHPAIENWSEILKP